MNKGWWGGGAPQWLHFDLQVVHKLDHAGGHYWDDSRYYQYKMQVGLMPAVHASGGSKRQPSPSTPQGSSPPSLRMMRAT